MSEDNMCAVAEAENGINAMVVTRAYQRGATRRVSLKECVIDVSGCLTLAYVAQSLGHDDLVSQFKEDGVFDSDDLPFRHYLDCGFFTLAQGRPGPVVLVTPEGQSWIARRYSKVRTARAGLQ